MHKLGSTNYTLDDNPQKIEVPIFPIDTIAYISVSLSTISTTTIMLLSLKTKMYQKPLGLMIFWVIFTDWLFDFPRFVDFFFRANNNTWCRAMILVTHFGLVSSFFWSAFFGHAILRLLRTHDIDTLAKPIRVYTFIAVSTLR